MQFDVFPAAPRTGGVGINCVGAPGVRDNANGRILATRPASPKPFSVTSLRFLNSCFVMPEGMKATML